MPLFASDDEFWTPQRVQHYHDYLQRGLPEETFVTFRRAYIRNIAYALQYLEFNAAVLKEPLHSIICNQVRKTFIITGCSLIESILWMLLKAKWLQKQDHWEEIQARETNPFQDGAAEFKFEVRQFRKRPAPIDIEMRFIDICRRAEKKKVLGITSEVYAQIGHLRGLRNRVHIHAVQNDRDNDWWTFRARDIETMKEVLRAVIRADIFMPFPNYSTLFAWLEPTAVPADEAASPEVSDAASQPPSK